MEVLHKISCGTSYNPRNQYLRHLHSHPPPQISKPRSGALNFHLSTEDQTPASKSSEKTMLVPSTYPVNTTHHFVLKTALVVIVLLLLRCGWQTVHLWALQKSMKEKFDKQGCQEELLVNGYRYAFITNLSNRTRHFISYHLNPPAPLVTTATLPLFAAECTLPPLRVVSALGVKLGRWFFPAATALARTLLQ